MPYYTLPLNPLYLFQRKVSAQELTIGKQHTSGNQKAEEDASKDADEQLKGIKAAGEKMGGKVVEDLLRVVVDVKVEVPDRVVAPTKG